MIPGVVAGQMNVGAGAGAEVDPGLDLLRTSTNVAITESLRRATTLSATVASTSSLGKPTTGKFYFEIEYLTIVSNYPYVGLGTTAASLGNVSGAGLYSCAANGTVRIVSTVNSGALPSFVAGERVRVAVDIAAGKIWFGKGATWAPAGSDPAAGTGGYTLTAATAFEARANFSASGASCRFHFLDDSWSLSAPSGFSEWPAGTPAASEWSSTKKGSTWVLSNSNLTATKNSTSFNHHVALASPRNQGKRYLEVHIDAVGTTNLYDPAIHLTDVEYGFTLTSPIPGEGTSRALLRNGQIRSGGSASAYLPAGIAAGDVVGVAVDFDAAKIWFSLNGAWVGGGDPSTTATPAFTALPNSSKASMLAANAAASSGLPGVTVRVKSSQFGYSMPDGFLPWSTP
ncbi:hypothetical protein B6S59_25490 [Pseudomonas sp. A46]|nr:hypothetical protein [Pseudomonas sp. A46]OWJ91127.1 hypothetical protein B6S59_25490 [Pseudomonas sp. A46]